MNDIVTRLWAATRHVEEADALVMSEAADHIEHLTVQLKLADQRVDNQTLRVEALELEAKRRDEDQRAYSDAVQQLLSKS